jgi:hypothetical protein
MIINFQKGIYDAVCPKPENILSGEPKPATKATICCIVRLLVQDLTIAGMQAVQTMSRPESSVILFFTAINNIFNARLELLSGWPVITPG